MIVLVLSGKIACAIEKLCEKERNTDTLKRLNKLIRENESGAGNLISALEAGKAADAISTQIEKRQKEKAGLEAQRAKERIQRPALKCDQIRFFFERFVGGDVDDITYRRALADTFINRIYLFADRLLIVYNAQDGANIENPLDETGSPKGRLVEARGVELRCMDFWGVLRGDAEHH